MARKLRVEDPGAIYPVMNRGDRRAQFERMMEERRRRDKPGEWKAVRPGWCFGEETFRSELLEQMSAKLGAHHGGRERFESAEVKADRLAGEETARRGWSTAELEQRPKADGQSQDRPATAR